MIVVWQVTDECNFSCGFCKYDKRLAIPRRQAQVDEVERFGKFTGAELGVPLAKIKTTNDVQNLVNTYRALRNKQPPSVCADCPSTQVFAKFRA
ncbi:hypothetical protein CN03_09560 [Thalassolituus oleivorans]|nr:hypothetical protein CN03_09560 [Thalassolituus oleivorans]